MASTYTDGFSLEKIGSGEQAGTWGTTSNHNWDIVDRLASYKAIAITTNADTHTLTVREVSPGSGTENLQDGMYRMIKFTGALDSNCTVTIAPNTAPAYFIIENATTDSGSSGPYSLVLSQGSGANVTVQNGKNVIVYCDGAGAGAAVADALADIQVGTLGVTGAAAIDGVTTHGGNVVSDTDSTDDLGTTTVRWANLFVDGITATDQITATGFTGTLDGILGSGTPAAATVTTIDASGVATAATFEPDGDTSADDAAAVGYTAAEGLILTGQGSTSDITLKNDADGTVFTVPTGTDDILFPDTAKAMWGASSKLQIYHDNNSFITASDAGGGYGLYLRSHSMYVQNADGSETSARFLMDNAAELYYDNSKKFETTAAGVTITGEAIATGFTGTLDGTLGSGTPAAASVTSVTSTGTASTYDTTDSTSGTSGSIHTDGGIGAAKDIVTDATFMARGDVAVGDSASVGGSASSGLLLIGQGSTRDVTIMNDTGTMVIGVPTGTLGVIFAGDISVAGALSKGSGSFKISHPLPAKKDTHHLVHSFIEGPQADLIYRGRATLADGTVTVNIDTAAGMTEGTFEVLCTDVQCFTSNEEGWTALKGSVTGNILTVAAQDDSCTDTINWMVIGERKDPHMLETDWTDEDGKVIVEPLNIEEGVKE